MRKLCLGLICFLFGYAGCTPSYLKKYTTKNQKESQGPAANADTNAPRKTLFGGLKRHAKTPSVYAVDNQTYRFKGGQKEVWDGVLSVLLKNYNLNIVDRTSGIITTEWDKFVLENNYYRNKVSIRVRPLRSHLTQVTIHNSVEKLQRSEVSHGFNNLWLPVKDEAQETSRIIQNLSIVMNLEPPQHIKSNVAKATK